MKEYKIKDLLTIRNGRDHKHLGNGVFPVYGSGGIMRYANDYLYNKPSILLPRKGTLDNIQYCDSPFWCVDTTYYSEVNEELVNPYYLYRYLNLLDLRNLDSGTALPSMTFDSYYQIKVKLPNIEIQNKIAKVLYSIDQKISLNTRLNAELEAMAKQLYDYWFVQFDFPDENGKPYKSSGGKMVWNEKLKREIPEGWEVKNLFYIAKFTNGIACQNYRPTDENKLPVIKIKEMHDGFGSDTEFTTTNIPEAVKVYNKDVLFSWSASLEVMLWSSGKGALNQHIFKVTSNNGYPKFFYYFQLKDYVNIFKKIAEARKTTMGHITQDHLEQSTIAVPPDLELPNLLEKRLCPIMDNIVKLNEERSYLTRLRDSLLPMLMNGQVTIE